MSIDFGERLEKLARMGEVDLIYIHAKNHWVCRLVVAGIESSGVSFSPEVAVEHALREMRERQAREKRAKEVSANVRAYLYNPRLTR